MIKLFRNIRRRMLRENRFTRYLIYAIGEIILVVIGILIALSLNNWKENQDNKKEEQFYLKKLQRSLATDTIELNQEIRGINLRLENLALLKSDLLDTTKNSFTKDSLIIAAVGLSSYALQTATFENLISTGKFELFSNQMLVDSIIQYYMDVKTSPAQQREALEHYSRNTIGPYLMQHEGGIFGHGQKPSDYRNEPLLLNAIETREVMLNRLQNLYRYDKDRVADLLRSIQKEIN